MRFLKIRFLLFAFCLLFLSVFVNSCKEETALAPMVELGSDGLIALARQHVDSVIREQGGAEAFVNRMGYSILWERAITDSLDNVRVPIQVDPAKTMGGIKLPEGAINRTVFELFVKDVWGKPEASIMQFIKLGEAYYPRVMGLDGRSRIPTKGRFTMDGKRMGLDLQMFLEPVDKVDEIEVLGLLSTYTKEQVIGYMVYECPADLLFDPIACMCNWRFDVQPVGKYPGYFLGVMWENEDGSNGGGLIPYTLETDPGAVKASQGYPLIPIEEVTVTALGFMRSSYTVGEEEISNSTDTRVVDYSWVFLQSKERVWQVVSKERATFRKIGGLWVLESLTHVGVDIVGNTPAHWNLDIDVRSAVPMVTPNGAQMTIDYQFYASATERGQLHENGVTSEAVSPVWSLKESVGSGNIKPTLEQIKIQIANKPFALFGDLDCDIVRKWLETARHQVQQAQIDKLNSIRMSTTQVPWATSEVIARVQDINDAYSTVVNMDYFPVTINQLPVVNGVRLTATEFKEYIRKNMNNFVDPARGNFTPYNYFGINDTYLWSSPNPNSAVVGIDIPGLWGINDEITDDDGAVIVSRFSNTGWTFTTIFDPKYGQHPVSGNRDFGYMQNANGSYTFFTRGVDRLTYFAVSALERLSRNEQEDGIPFAEADALWESFQDKIANFVNQNGGQAAVALKEIQRPDWQLIKDVIDGRTPLSSLSSDCK